jgi:hypothetical protein
MANALGNNGGRFYSPLYQPVLIDCNFIVDSTNGNGLGIRSLKGQGVRNVFMNTSASPGSNRGLTNPNPAAGYAIIQLDANYFRYCGGFYGFASPTSGGTIAIDSTSLTPSHPYIVVSPGHTTAGSETITAVADVSGSLASRYFNLLDSYGNNFLLWFQVSGVGNAPANVYGQPVPVSITSGATASQVASALSTVIGALPSGVSGVYSFTSSPSSAVVTVTSTTTVAPLAGVAQDGASPLATGFTFAIVYNGTNLSNWQTVGLPLGLNPTQGQSFIAAASGDGGHSTGTVIAAGVSGIQSIELVGDPNQSIAPAPQGGSPHNGALLIIQFLAPTSPSVTTAIPTAPANGTTVGLSFEVEAKSILVNGE